MKVLIVFLVLFSTIVEVLGQTSILSTDLIRVKQIYEEVDSLKSISVSNKAYIDSLDVVYFTNVQIKCPDFVGQKTIIDKKELRIWAAQYQSQFTEYKAILEEFIAEIELN